MTVGELLLNLKIVGSKEAVKDINNVLGTIKKISDVTKLVGNSIKTLGNGISNVGGIITNVGKGMTNYITKPLLNIGAASIQTAMTFDRQMSRVSAVTGETGTNFTTLRKLAIDMGSKTTKTATEAAEAIEYMGLAGWDMGQIQKGLEPILRASEAGMMDLGLTSDLVTDSMSALGIGINDITRYLNIAANAQNMSNQSMRQFLEAMLIAGGTFKRLETPLEEAGALLGVLAERGYKGSRAGRALISIMNNLTVKSGQSGKAMKELGIETYDTNGKFKGITVILKELNAKFAKLTDEQRDTYIQMIGGKMRTKELDALLNGTSTTLDKFTKRLYNSDGALSKMAETMQKNLGGQVIKLKSILEGIAIQIGTLLTPIISAFVKVLQNLSEWFFNLDTTTKYIILAFSGLLASIGPIIVIIGSLITSVGVLVTAIGGLITLIGTVGLPVIAAVTAAIIALPIYIGALVAGIGSFVAILGTLLARLGILGDGLATIKALISGDFNRMFSLLTNNFGMNERAANKLSNAFSEMYRKGKIVLTVIKNNLIPVFNVLKDAVINSFKNMNNSTSVSRGIFIDFVQRIVSWGSKLVNYFYKIFDEFDLIPTKLKFANNKIAAEFVQLNAKTNSNLDNIINSQFIFGKTLTDENLKIYNKKVNDTKTLMDKELALVLESMNKRKNIELNSLQDLFNSSSVLTATEEAKRVQRLKDHYTQRQTSLQENNARIKEIMTNASNEKRALNQYEIATIDALRKEFMNNSIRYISTSEAEQIRIMEEAKNLKTSISKKEAMNIIAEANRAYDAVVNKANKQKNDKINAIIQQRDGTKVISKDEADKMIREAQRQADTVISKARQTKNTTISEASRKAGGVISAAEKEKRETTNQADKIKAVLNKIWNDIKKSLPSKTREALGAVAKAIIANKAFITRKAFEVGAALVSSMISGIASKIGQLTLKIGELMSKVNIIGTIPKFASGVRNFKGGLAIVGEKGPELIRLPKGSDVFTANNTQSMLSNINMPLKDMYKNALRNNIGTFSGTSSNVTFNINASHMDVDQLGRMLVSKFRSYGIRSQTE